MDNETEQEWQHILTTYPPDTDWTNEFIEARQDAAKHKEACLRKDEEMDTLTLDNARLREDNNELAQINGIMQKLLVMTANALKGEPEYLHMHDWSDLHTVAKELKGQLDNCTEYVGVQAHLLKTAQQQLRGEEPT